MYSAVSQSVASILTTAQSKGRTGVLLITSCSLAAMRTNMLFALTT